MNGQNASLNSRPRFFCVVFFLRFPVFLFVLEAEDFLRGADLRLALRASGRFEVDFLAAIMWNEEYLYGLHGGLHEWLTAK